MCYKTWFFPWIICIFKNSPYICNMFFIVLDLRLTKVGVRRYSFFFAFLSDNKITKNIINGIGKSLLSNGGIHYLVRNPHCIFVTCEMNE